MPRCRRIRALRQRASTRGRGYDAPWTGAFPAPDDGEALPRFAVALMVLETRFAADELAGYDPSAALLTLLRDLGSGGAEVLTGKHQPSRKPRPRRI